MKGRAVAFPFLHLEAAMECRIEAGGVRIAAESFGDPQGVPVVLVMGATAQGIWWPEALCRDLAGRGMFVIRYDHRDTGASSAGVPGAPDYAVEDLAGDLMAVMDGFGLRAAHVVGMSLGGLIGQIVALRWPGRVVSLCLIGAEPLGWDGPDLPGIAPEFLEHFAGFADLDWADKAAVAEFLLEIARLSAGGGAFDAEPARARIGAEMARAGQMRTAFNHGMLGLRDDWSGQFRRIGVPVLVVHGRNDPILPLANGQALAAGIPGARLEVLDGVGHELPARILPQLAGLIAGHVGV
jgi:pimeloyl-ACP methyl ester carboxylesterase